MAVSFVRDLRNLTVIYKPNAHIYHVCQTSHQINFKRIRWHYDSLLNTSHENDHTCKNLFNSSDCFDFYYGPSTSVLVVKEPDLYSGKYSCHVTINSTHDISTSGYIDVKLPSNEFDDEEESINMFNEKELAQLAHSYNVPFILDEVDPASFGKRVQVGGIFQTRCQSISTSDSNDFLWFKLKNGTDDRQSERIKTIHFIQSDGKRILIENKKFSSK